MEKIPKFNKRRAFNKAVGPGKIFKIIKRRARVYKFERLHILKLKRCAPQKVWHVISEVIDLCKITSTNTNPVKIKENVLYSIYGFSCRNFINNIYPPRPKKLIKLWKSVKENKKHQSWWIILETSKCLQQVGASEVFKHDYW